MRKCNNCNRSTFDSAKFCHHCGSSMTENEDTSTSSKKEDNSIFANIDTEKVKQEIEFEIVTESATQDTEEKETQETTEFVWEEADDLIFEEANVFETTDATEATNPPPTTPQQDPVEVPTTSQKEEIPFDEQDSATTTAANDLFENNPNARTEKEIFEKFAIAFEHQLKIEQGANLYNQYVDRFESSDFKISFESRIKQLAEEINKIRLDQANLLKDENQVLETAFTELIDYFVIRYCQDLNTVKFSEKILKYQNVPSTQIDLSEMVMDYLDFRNENERIHTDFIKMPLQRMRNASKSFLFPEKGEKIFFICDQTILGSGKEGFAMTEKAIYWKMPFENPERVYYRNLKSIEPQKDWLTINEMFFNANPTLNIKMMKLLKKLKTMF